MTSKQRKKANVPDKSREILGLLLFTLGLLVAGSLLTYFPDDPSFLYQSGDGRGEVRNLIGSVGANLSALLMGFMGLAAFLLPLVALVPGWRRLRGHSVEAIIGRGFGAILELLALPALFQLAFGEVPWRGARIPAGGVLGVLEVELLEGRLGAVGTLIVFSTAAIIGITLLVQSTLGDLLRSWSERARDAWQHLSLVRVRRRERKSKEDARRRVVTKHLERAKKDKKEKASRKTAAEPPMRVVPKPGKGEFSVRKVAGQESGGSKKKRGTQSQIAFSESAKRPDLPPINLLHLDKPKSKIQENELMQLGTKIRERCAEFGVEGTIQGISPGPVITVFEFQPAPGVKVSRIVALQDDLALALSAESVRIDRLAGRSTLGIEVPNGDRQIIRLGRLFRDDRFVQAPSLLSMAIGTTIHGEPYYADLAQMPHLLVAGATGSGKSVGLQAMITSILYKARRDQVQFIFIDPKRIELGVYKDIPHLKTEVVVEPKKAANALRWAVAEMERRYRLLAEVRVRSIDFYNRCIESPEERQKISLSSLEDEAVLEDLEPLPYYVVVIDELADLMMVAAADVETSIARLAQMARAVGIHLIVATQRPSVDVLTGTIKANFPCRMAFATASRHDSRTILDQVGSEKLLGRGDMLFMAPGTSRVIRLHGAYISEEETASLIRWLKKQGPPELDRSILDTPEKSKGGGDSGGSDDALFDEAARLVVREGQGSASFLQRRLRVGFSRASRLIDMMEQDGLLGPSQGSKPREVLVQRDYFEEVDRAQQEV